jgi:hypothetical protein
LRGGAHLVGDAHDEVEGVGEPLQRSRLRREGARPARCRRRAAVAAAAAAAPAVGDGAGCLVGAVEVLAGERGDGVEDD